MVLLKLSGFFDSVQVAQKLAVSVLRTDLLYRNVQLVLEKGLRYYLKHAVFDSLS